MGTAAGAAAVAVVGGGDDSQDDGQGSDHGSTAAVVEAVEPVEDGVGASSLRDMESRFQEAVRRRLGVATPEAVCRAMKMGPKGTTATGTCNTACSPVAPRCGSRESP